MSYEGKSNQDPIDLTRYSPENTTKECSRIIRRRKPKKFRNLSEVDIEERRHTANIQERTRMKKLSKALDELRRCIPTEYHLSNRKMSKIRTLRLATNYIASLSEIINRDNFVKQQAFQFETQMMQSTYSYLAPRSRNVTHSFTSYESSMSSCPTPVSPYHTPFCASSEQRLPRRHLNFSPFETPSRKFQGKEEYQTSVKSGMTPFRFPIFRNRTSTNSVFSDFRNLNELNASFTSPEIDVGRQTKEPKLPYTYILEGVCPMTDDEQIYSGSDCIYDPKRPEAKK